MSSMNRELNRDISSSTKVLNWLQDNRDSNPDCQCCRKRKLTTALNTTSTVRTKGLQDRLALLNQRRQPLKKRDEELVEKNRQLRQRAQVIRTAPMSPIATNPNTIIRSKILRDRLDYIQKKMTSVRKRDAVIQEKNRQVQEKFQDVLNISLTSLNVCHEESAAKRPRLETTFQRNSVVRKMVRRGPRVQSSRAPTLTFNTSAAFSVSSAHDLKTYLKNGLQCSLC